MKLSLFLLLPLVFYVLPNTLTKEAKNIPKTQSDVMPEKKQTCICVPSLTVIFLFTPLTTINDDHKTGNNQPYRSLTFPFWENSFLLAAEVDSSHCALINIHRVDAMLNSKLRRETCSKPSRLISMPDFCSCILGEQLLYNVSNCTFVN